jgi:hypothetical protein
MVLTDVLLNQGVRAFPMEEVNRCKPLAEMVFGLVHSKTQVISIEDIRILLEPLTSQWVRPKVPNRPGTVNRGLDELHHLRFSVDVVERPS